MHTGLLLERVQYFMFFCQMYSWRLLTPLFSWLIIQFLNLWSPDWIVERSEYTMLMQLNLYISKAVESEVLQIDFLWE